MSLLRLPLLLIPVVAYNILALITGSGAEPLFAVTLPSGTPWSLSAFDLILVVGLLLLFVEMAKSTRTSNASIVDHMLSVLLLMVCVVEFAVVAVAGTTTFFLLLLMTLMDVVAGFTVTITGARRDYSR